MPYAALHQAPRTIQNRAVGPLTPAEWVSRLVTIRSANLRAHCANLIWWDYVADRYPDGTPPAFTALRRPVNYRALDTGEVARALVHLGYHPEIAATRATPPKLPARALDAMENPRAKSQAFHPDGICRAIRGWCQGAK